MSLIDKLFRGDRVIWMVFFILCLVSVVEVFSATSTLAYKSNYWKPIMRHTTLLLVGVAVILFLVAIPTKLYSLVKLLLPVSWILMLVAMGIGTKTNDAARWIDIFGLSFQPSEFAKLSLIVVVAGILSRYHEDEKLNFIKIITYTGITCFIILIENFSTALLLGTVVFALMVIAKVPWKKLGAIVGTLALALTLLLLATEYSSQTGLDKVFPRLGTWKNRIDSDRKVEIGPEFKINDENFQEAHARIAIARGGLFGVLPGNSLQRDVLPQAYSDFIYAIIIEELGLLLGGVGVMLLYVILFLRSGRIAHRSDKSFSKYLVMGSALLIVLQAFTNMSVATGVIPVTGQPLPLISRGGTSTIINCVYFGFILGVSRYDNLIGRKRDESVDQSLEEGEVEYFLNEQLLIANEALKQENEALRTENEQLKETE